MPITSHIEEGFRGRGHSEHGNGRGVGHQRHAERAMEDGVYTIEISDIDHVNHTGTNQTSSVDTLADGTFMWTEVRDGSITIDLDAPLNDGDSSALRLETDSNNGRLRLNDFFDSDNQLTLGDLDQLSFDYFVASSDRPDSDVIPVVRLRIDADGDLSTTGDIGELVFEYAYQGLGPVQEGTWQEADLVGEDWVAWQRSNNTNWDQIINMTELSDWADEDGFTPDGGITFDEDSVILGWSIAYGSGNGTGVMYVDDLQVAGVTYEFA